MLCIPLPVICRGMLRKLALPDPVEEKFEDLQADGGSPHYGTFVHGGLGDKFLELSFKSRTEKCRTVCELNSSA